MNGRADLMGGMRIAIVVDKCAPFYVGGYEVRAFELARRLAHAHDVRIYTSLEKSKDIKDGVSFYRLLGTGLQKPTSGERNLFHSLLYSTCLWRNPFGKWEPDVVIVESIPYFHLMLMRRWIKKATPLCLLNVNEAWSNYPYRAGSSGKLLTRAVKRFLEAGVAWADCCIAISNVTASSLTTNYSAPNVRVIPMGVGEEVFHEYGPSTLATKRFDFVSMSRLVPIKRLDDFLKALALIKDVHAWDGFAAIIGFGPERESLVSLRDALGLRDQVQFLGVLQGDDKYRALRASQVFVLPSEREGFSIAALEAIACGLPVIVARPVYPEVFGTSDFIIPDQTGMYYSVGDVAALAECMHKLLTDQNFRQRLSRNAALVGREYTWDDISTKLESLIRSMSSTSCKGALRGG